jgi:hypothetical protein
MSDCCSVNVKTGTAPAMMACPVNGARSKQVETLTVKSLVRQLPLGMSNDQYYFCEARDCDVVYFPSTLKRRPFVAKICWCGLVLKRRRTLFRFATVLASRARTFTTRSPRQGTRRSQNGSQQK